LQKDREQIQPTSYSTCSRRILSSEMVRNSGLGSMSVVNWSLILRRQTLYCASAKDGYDSLIGDDIATDRNRESHNWSRHGTNLLWHHWTLEAAVILSWHSHTTVRDRRWCYPQRSRQFLVQFEQARRRSEPCDHRSRCGGSTTRYRIRNMLVIEVRRFPTLADRPCRGSGVAPMSVSPKRL
jgi:hypothetical protein